MSGPGETRFGDWTLRMDTGELSRDGRSVRLQEQPLQILRELLKQPGALVTREHLIGVLWPSGVVEFDTGLNTAIRKLRAALDDDPAQPRYIETIPRKGYRLIAPLSLHSGQGMDSPAPALPMSRGAGRWARPAVLGLVLVALAAALWLVRPRPPAPGNSIVVLPLQDMSTDQRDRALCDGVTEEVSNWLAQIPALQVVARTSAFSFKDKNEDVRSIGRQLGAAHVLEGSLRRSADTVRITVQLVSTDTGYHLWSRTFDLRSADVLRVEDAVARGVAEALNVQLTAQVARRWAQRQSSVASAHEYYLQGLPEQRRRTVEGNARAQQLYRAAIATDAGFAPAYVRLAQSLLNDIALGGRTAEEVAPEVIALTDKALQLAPDDPAALATQGWLATERFQLPQAETLLSRAVALQPNDADARRLYGNALAQLARPADALAQFSRAAELDPLDFMTHVLRCQSLRDLARFDEAGDACEASRRLDGNNLWGPLATSWLAYARGDLAEAYRWALAADRLSPADAYLFVLKTELLLSLGMFDEARRLGEATAGEHGVLGALQGARVAQSAGAQQQGQALDAVPAAALQDADSLLSYAQLQLAAGRPGPALQSLQRARSAPDFRVADTIDPAYFCLAYSSAIPIAAIEAANGQRPQADALLGQLLRELERAARHGVKCYGVHALRAEALALQGRHDEAIAQLRLVLDSGWSAAFSAEHDPYFDALRGRGDFLEVLRSARERSAAMARQLRQIPSG